MAEIGDNSIDKTAQGRLKDFLDRFERLDEQMDEMKADVKEVFAQFKGEGFDPKAMRKLLQLRKKDKARVLEDKAMLEMYAAAIGCLDLV